MGPVFEGTGIDRRELALGLTALEIQSPRSHTGDNYPDRSGAD